MALKEGERKGELEPMPKKLAIAIDGPVASGKGTLAQLLAERLDGFYLYTSGMYRAVALACIERGIDFDNEYAIAKLASASHIHFKGNRTFLDERDVTDRIKTQHVSDGSSKIGVFPSVRRELVMRQQEIARIAMEKGQVVVAEGRDTGTVVLPEAGLKIFLTATLEVRAQRRFSQYQEQGVQKTFQEVLQEIKERDKRDTERETDPLVSHPEEAGYWVLDNSHKTKDETLEVVLNELKKGNLIGNAH